MILEVDAGEKAIIEQLEKKGVEYITTGAAIGDMRKGDTVVERKEINDFFNSMGDHLTNQYMDMSCYPQKWLIVSGYFDQLSSRHLKKMPQYYGMIARLARQGICIQHVKNDAMLVSVALSIMDKAEKLPSDFRIVKREKDALRGIINAAAPRIKKKSLEDMVEKFQTPLGVALASVEDLKKIDGIGGTTAKRIWENFRKNKNGEIQNI